MADNTNPKDLIGVQKAPLRLVPPALMIETAAALALGAQKYGPYNWRENDVRLTVYLEALLRHVFAYMDGQDLDTESGESHLSHAAACIAIIFDAGSIGRLVDDRPPAGGAADLLAVQDKSSGSAADRPSEEDAVRRYKEFASRMRFLLGTHDEIDRIAERYQ